MKTIEQITDEIHAVNKWDRKHDILKEWAHSIVDSCKYNAERYRDVACNLEQRVDEVKREL
jgi:hypothetical protein